jgi:hypothetical protein
MPLGPVPGGDRVGAAIPLPDPATTPDLSTKLVAPARHTALSEDEGARAEPMIATVAGGVKNTPRSARTPAPQGAPTVGPTAIQILIYLTFSVS